jgi:hypothetical protein
MTKSNLTAEEVLTTENFNEKLNEFIGKRVTAYVGGKVRASHDNAICVTANLEKHPTNGSYRLLTDDSNYTYFDEGCIEQIVSHESHVFKGGSLAVIKLKI